MPQTLTTLLANLYGWGMFTRVKIKAPNRWQIQIVESIRVKDTTQQRIVRNVGTAYSEKEIESFKRIGDSLIAEMKAERQPLFDFVKPEDVYSPRKRNRPKATKAPAEYVKITDLKEEKRVNQGLEEFFGPIYSKFGFDEAIKETGSDKKWNDVLKSCVLARIGEPNSKRKTRQYIEDQFDVDIPLHEVYRMMNHLCRAEDFIKSKVAANTLDVFNQKVDIMFFDVTTLYFESIRPDELRNFGFSKDCKFKETQVVLALVTTEQGLPITYELFPGNTCEGKTLIEVINKLKFNFKISRVVLAADRAMFTEANLSFLESEGVKYVVAAKLKAMSKDIKDKILVGDACPAVVSSELHWIKEIELNNRRLIISYSSRRAKSDSANRQRAVDRLLKKSKENRINLKDLIPNHGNKKYVIVKNEKVEINQDKINEDGEWDGLHGVITNIEEETAQAILERYRGLWQIEEAFRVNKHTLKMRPIYHWTPRRIRSHVTLCYMAYAILRYAQYVLKLHNVNISLETLREELQKAQASILVSKTTQKRYVIPSAPTENLKQAYSVFNLSRGSTVRMTQI